MSGQTDSNSSFAPGMCVTWARTQRGGYGFTEYIPAAVLRCSEKRVLIRVATRTGEIVDRWVAPEKLKLVAS